MVKVTFFGVRGSTPCAGDQTRIYGGHTSCVTVETNGAIFILDAGSGIFEASELVATKHPNGAHLLLSHGHLDHVMGLPFFKPIWNKEYSLNIYGGTFNPYGGVQSFLNSTFKSPLFPVPFEKFGAHVTFKDFNGGDTLEIDGIKIDTHVLNHPNGAVGYRLNSKKTSVCYVTDHEHTPGVLDERLIQFIQGTDLFIYDASYDDHTFDKYKGWGHSTWQQALRMGDAAGVKHTVLFHHDPASTDEVMKHIEAEALKISPSSIVARQGMVVEL